MSPNGFGGLTVSELKGAFVVVNLLGSGVVATVNVLLVGLLVVLVVVDTVVDRTLRNSVTFGSDLSSPSTASGPVGPQSINPATVVARPSGDLSSLATFSCLLPLSNNLIVFPLLPLDKGVGASANAAKGPPVCEY